MYNLLFTLINLLFAVLLIVAGIFIFMIPNAPHFRETAISLFTNNSPLLTYFGIGIGVVGLLLLVVLYTMNRKHCYFLTMGSHGLSIEKNVMQKYLSAYWKGLFPGAEPHHEVSIKNNQIYLSVDLPHVPFDEQKKVLERIEKELQKLFIETFDYHKEFFVTVSFQEKP